MDKNKSSSSSYFLTLPTEVASSFIDQAQAACAYWYDEKDLARLAQLTVEDMCKPIKVTPAQAKKILDEDRVSVDVAVQLVLFGFLIYG